MRNFLQISQDVLLEAGISGSGPTSVTNVTGIEKRIVGWVRQAWIDIQQYRGDWPWMEKDFSFNTSPGKQGYPLTELLLTDVERWLFNGHSAYRVDLGEDAEFSLGALSYESWYKHLRSGPQRPGQPNTIIVHPVSSALIVYPIPDAEYTVKLRYYQTPFVLTLASDIPGLPTNQAWREIIKWRALWYYGYHDGNADVLVEAETTYSQMIHALDNRYGQTITIGARPIA